MKKINVMEIIGSTQIGGAEKQVVGLVKYLDKEKYNVLLCCLGVRGPLEEELEGHDVEIVHLRHRRRYFIITFIKLVRLLKSRHIDVLHAHLYFPGYWGRLAALVARTPIVVYTDHGSPIWKKRRQVLFERIANSFTDMRISVSSDIRRLCIDREKTAPDKIEHVPNGIDVARFRIPGDRSALMRKELGISGNDLVIGTVARLHRAKALDYMLQAFVIVKKTYPGSRCLIIGDGPMRAELEKTVSALNLDSSVFFLGPRTDIPELLSALDIFVLPSISEGTPVSVLEAFAARIPVVATNVGGVPEILSDRENGILVPPRDSEKLAQGIRSLFVDEALRESLIEKAYIRVADEYSLSAITNRIEKVYDRILLENTVDDSNIR